MLISTSPAILKTFATTTDNVLPSLSPEDMACHTSVNVTDLGDESRAAGRSWPGLFSNALRVTFCEICDFEELEMKLEDSDGLRKTTAQACQLQM